MMPKSAALPRPVLEWLTAAPWTKAKQAAFLADPENRPLIWLLVDREEAELLTHGQVAEDVAEMAERALKGVE